MDNLFFFSLFLTVIAILSPVVFCSVTTKANPDAGFEVVLVDKPFFFGKGGVQPEPVKTGSEWTWRSTNHIHVDMRPVQFKIHLDGFMSKDGVPLDFDAVVRLRVTDSVSLISKFGEGWYENNVENEVINRVRNAVRKHKMNEITINTTAIGAIDEEVTNGLVSYIKETELPIELIHFTVGKANPPVSIKYQIFVTASQQWRTLTEYQGKEAETSSAEADNAFRNAMNMSPEQFIALEYIEAIREVCGSGGNCTFLIGENGVSPVIPTATAK
ncbi:MAG: SPFH domain-containing protein [Candidatus Magasanikbacteria bacterium]|nr:SPFH domain-containing protein [Candidatus Magasanikbacteria bacterium]